MDRPPPPPFLNQVVLWDGMRQNVVGEYPNEMEALVASELMSPALPPIGNLQAGGMNAFMTSDPRGPSMHEVCVHGVCACGCMRCVRGGGSFTMEPSIPLKSLPL